MGELTCKFCNEEKNQTLIENILFENNCPVCGKYYTFYNEFEPDIDFPKNETASYLIYKHDLKNRFLGTKQQFEIINKQYPNKHFNLITNEEIEAFWPTTFTDKISNELAEFDQIIILCGHYEGFDERIREIIKPREISIGDFVLTGGELPALCLIDSVSRKIEGTLGKIESAHDDSFSDGLLEYPQYTKPREYRGLKVPYVLLEGNHKLIEEFRLQQKIERTKLKRPDLYKKWSEKNL